MSLALLVLAGCSSAADEQAYPPDLATMASPCDFLRDDERKALGVGPGELTAEAGLGTGQQTTMCVFRATEPWNRQGEYVDSISVTFLPTSLDVARVALESVEEQGIFTARRMSKFGIASDGVLQRDGARLGESTCERLFPVNDNRSVQVGFTIELSPMGEPTCHAAARLAPVADGRIPRPAAT